MDAILIVNHCAKHPWIRMDQVSRINITRLSVCEQARSHGSVFNQLGPFTTWSFVTIIDSIRFRPYDSARIVDLILVCCCCFDLFAPLVYRFVLIVSTCSRFVSVYVVHHSSREQSTNLNRQRLSEWEKGKDSCLTYSRRRSCVWRLRVCLNWILFQVSPPHQPNLRPLLLKNLVHL